MPPNSCSASRNPNLRHGGTSAGRRRERHTHGKKGTCQVFRQTVIAQSERVNLEDTREGKGNRGVNPACCPLLRAAHGDLKGEHVAQNNTDSLKLCGRYIITVEGKSIS